MESNLRKILMITARADFGGGPQHVFLLLKYLNTQYDFYIACPDDFPYMQRYKDILGKEKIIIIPHRKFETKVLSLLLSFCKENEIQLIHSHGKGAGVYGRLIALFTTIPCIHTFHGLHTGSYNKMQKNLYKSLERFFSFFTRLFITVSKSEHKRIVNFNVTSLSKIIIVENGVEVNNTAPKREILNEDIHQIITLTRFDYAKNTGLLVPIMEHLREKNELKYFKFIILGSGPDELKVKKLISNRSLDKYIIFKGTVLNPKDYLKESFCYISTSRWEGMPLGVLEAMASGVPIIATNVTGNIDAVQNNISGFLYDISSPESAAEYLIRLKNDLNLWKKFSAVSFEKVRKYFSAEIMGEKTAQIYSHILKSK